MRASSNGQRPGVTTKNRRTVDGQTWILAADSARARIFEMAPREKRCTEIEGFVNPEGRAQNRDLNAEPQGRFYGRGDKHEARSAWEGESPVEHDVKLFAKEIGRYLDKARTQNRYDRLFIIAPPEFLGLIRQNTTNEVQKLVAGEINKDLSKASAREIEKYILESTRLH